MPHHGKPPQPKSHLVPQLKRLRDDKLLDISNSIIAGRHSSCGIDLSQEEGASRKHARFNIDHGQLTITDLGSLNGTLVNGIEIDGKHTLKNSDIIIFDTDKYLLSIPRAKPTTQNTTSNTTSSTSDTVIADKAERNNPDSIEPAIRVLTNTADEQPVEQQHANTLEYLSSLPSPDMKRPVGMPEPAKANNTATLLRKWLLPLLGLVLLVIVAYQLGLRAA